MLIVPLYFYHTVITLKLVVRIHYLPLCLEMTGQVINTSRLARGICSLPNKNFTCKEVMLSSIDTGWTYRRIHYACIPATSKQQQHKLGALYREEESWSWLPPCMEIISTTRRMHHVCSSLVCVLGCASSLVRASPIYEKGRSHKTSNRA